MERLLQDVLKQVQQAEVYWIEEESLPVHFSNKEVSRINGKKTVGISLRIINNDGRLGFATSTTLDREDLIQRALLSAQYGDKTSICFPKETNSEEVQCYDPKIAQMTVEEIVKQGWEMVEILEQLDPSIQFELDLGKEIQKIRIMNSSGLNVSFERTNFAIGLSSRSKDGFYEYNDWDIFSNHFTIDRARLERFVKFHNLSQTKIKVKTGKMDIIFNPGASWPLLYRVGVGVNGQMINRGLSPLNNRLGEKICNPMITIVDDPTFPWGFASTPYDDEGNIAKRKPIIEKGVLKNYLFDLEDATQYGDGVIAGNGFKKSLFEKGIDLKPATYVSNCILLPGEDTFEKMVKQTKYGIIVNGIMGGHTGNAIAGEFALNVGSGFLVEDGEIKGKVVDAMVSGNIYDLLKKVKMVGNELHATQAVFYGYGYAPAIFVPELTVAGSEE